VWDRADGGPGGGGAGPSRARPSLIFCPAVGFSAGFSPLPGTRRGQAIRRAAGRSPRCRGRGARRRTRPEPLLLQSCRFPDEPGGGGDHLAAVPEAVDRNFAIHLPVIDHLFGTAYFPHGRWPDVTGWRGYPCPTAGCVSSRGRCGAGTDPSDCTMAHGADRHSTLSDPSGQHVGTRDRAQRRPGELDARAWFCEGSRS
jgi:hypothetical protein